MKHALRLSGKTAIILFVLWHTYAVAVYTVPRDAKDRYAQWIIAELIPDVTPYMLQTSQWQLWNLFSPDPLRRVTFYRVQTLDDETWTDVERIEPGHYSVWRHSTRFKMMGNMFDENAQNRGPLARRFLHLACREHGIAPGTNVRLLYEYYVIPYHTARQSRAWWDAWLPTPQQYVGFETLCP